MCLLTAAVFQALVGRSFFLIRTLAGSDKVKGHIMKAGAAEIIVTTLETLKVSSRSPSGGAGRVVR